MKNYFTTGEMKALLAIITNHGITFSANCPEHAEGIDTAMQKIEAEVNIMSRVRKTAPGVYVDVNAPDRWKIELKDWRHSVGRVWVIFNHGDWVSNEKSLRGAIRRMIEEQESLARYAGK